MSEWTHIKERISLAAQIDKAIEEQKDELGSPKFNSRPDFLHKVVTRYLLAYETKRQKKKRRKG